MLRQFGVAACAAVLACGSVSLGQGITIPTESFNYGTCANAPPNYCCSSDQVPFLAAWPPAPGFATGTVANDFANCTTNSGFRGAVPPFSYYHPKSVSLNVKDLGAMAAAINPAMNAVNGTDTSPLVVEGTFFMNTPNKQWDASLYVQLYAGTSYAPVTRTVPDPANPGQTLEIPLVLQHADCTGLATFDIYNTTPSVPRSAIAFGFHGGVGGLIPKNECPLYVNYQMYHNVIYDGDHWSQLKTNFPAASTGGLDWNTSQKTTWFRMTVKSATIDLEMRTNDTGNVLQTMTGIPRKYFGPFQGLGIGSGISSAVAAYLDEITLSGGELQLLAGACCQGSGGCAMTSESQCTSGNGTFNGLGTTCADATVHCCNDPAADYDGDHDVDMADFANLQRCLTIGGGSIAAGCQCFDLDHNLKIDSADVELFANCGSGSGVPADPACDNPI
jgi:hypothetical protein